ncbi:MAG TPA: DUF3488 and transglutaminase-like domain-containing protein [Candidatus Ruania gallistercoris]|uniref:DUF3488 and transglutaminase-like domain-containing protein n=1 Tax=Candidatus Ruania gallistercoris TaxID=2838746 RepID=A0A9D2EJ21_9MICO|nr:DUF3488 and transglutaminase-like domain-containing protein [Candidatus Ruania gallistercoris]
MTRAVLLSLATAGTVLASMFALDRLVAPSLWFAPVLTTLVVILTVLSLMRRWTRRGLVPTLVATLAGAGTIIAWYAHDEALLGVLPTRSAIETLYYLFRGGLSSIEVALPPIDDAPGVGLMVTCSAAVVYLLADLLAVPGRSPAWALLPIATVWALPVLLLAPVRTVAIVATGVGFLAMLATGAEAWREPSGSTSPRRMGALAAVTAAVLAVALVAAPWVLSIPSPVRWHSPTELADADATRLDLGLDLRSDLNRPRDAVVMTYDGVRPRELGPLHAYTLTTFDGATWDRTPTEEWEDAENRLLWPDAVETEDSDSARVTINDLGQDRLPIPGEPRRVEVDGAVSYSAAADEVRLEEAAPGELSYRVTFRTRDLGAAALADLDPSTLDADPALLQIPDTGYGPDIAELTQEIVTDAGAETPYDQLLAIQNYLRDPDLFTYTESVTSARTRDAVWDFLQDRRGYCVQFGTAMVVMARTLDLPARLAVGYLPGEIQEDGTASISAHQAHAWPQVLFPEVGWVRFEPTPGVQSGSTPSWAPEPVAETPDSPTTGPTQTTEPEEETSTTGSAEEESSEESSSEDETEAAGSAQLSSALPGLVLLAALVLVGLVGVLALRRHRARSSGELETAWRQAVGMVRAAGGAVQPGSTPRAVAAAGAEVFSTASARTALHALADAVERSRYAPGGGHTDPQTVRAWMTQIAADRKDRSEAGEHVDSR